MAIRGRFAPSPTGELHVGNARTALLAWLQVRSQGGTFVLRIEDLDTGRSRAEFADVLLADLRWLGLDWDEGPDVGGGYGPYLQSARGPRYERAIERLRRLGLVYSCRCSRREIAAAASAPHVGEEGPPYPGTCGALRIDDPDDEACALRFRVPGYPVDFVDLLHGPVRFEPSRETGDFAIRRKDGIAAYQLAVVVDDAEMEMTDVLRGADLLSSAARQILLYEALQLPVPRWTHVPLMLLESGERLSKRHKSLALHSLRKRAISPERLVGWLASTCGLIEPGREAAPRDLLESFDFERLPAGDTPVRIPDWLT